MLPGDDPRPGGHPDILPPPVMTNGHATASSHGRLLPTDSSGKPRYRPTASTSSLRDASPPSPGGHRFVRDGRRLPPPDARSKSSSPLRLPLPCITPGQLAFSALQFLPVPMLVLNSLKTVVLANEAMGRLLGMVPDAGDSREDTASVMDRLRGQTLSQVGIDMLQDGKPVWLAWDQFLDSLVLETGVHSGNEPGNDASSSHGGAPPMPPDHTGRADSGAYPARPKPDAAVEVVVSRKDLQRTVLDRRPNPRSPESQAHAKMIVTVWELENDQTYFTLTFTHNETSPTSLPTPRRAVARPHVLEAAERKTVAQGNPPPTGGSSQGSSTPSYIVSPGTVMMSSTPFPPMGPPSKASLSGMPSILQKTIIMKDTLLDNTETPILAMWKDGSVTFPNAAARHLFRKDALFDRRTDGFALLHNWDVYTEDFETKLEASDYPMGVLVKTETPFAGRRVGMYAPDGSRKVFDVLGEAIRDERTGEFLAGVTTCRDVTTMAQEITQIKARDEERFRLICDTMPQLVFTTLPDGMHDFFNSRWYDYTGLTREQSVGDGWLVAFHPDDVAEASRRWYHSLETGEPFMTEYRCRSKEGEYRWMLVRALPQRNPETGKIEKWFGTFTDVHDHMETRLAAYRTRQQLLSVIAHSQVTIFTVDLDRNVTMLEGALIWDAHGEHNAMNGYSSRWYIGKNVHDVFRRLTRDFLDGHEPDFLDPVVSILTTRGPEEHIREHGLDGRWYRTRFLPIRRGRDGDVGEAPIEGVIGVIMDVTELKQREAALKEQEKEKNQLMANEAAAKEASRLKSQFLANMSHEIRTPITGVIGMAELLLDSEVAGEEREYAENIYRSANALLTVINDILDFSKVESGRLDIEEVQFSMSIIVRDVSKMLSFAAQRKNLDFRSDISPDIEEDMALMGDPGRVRQIITNLVTNSIKFTNHGYVRFSVLKEKETADTIEVKFMVEDTGIGIEDEVRKKLFQPFSQGDASTARRFGGTGLGLTICKNLLDLMHGRMTLESTVGQGTTATFWIPFNKPQDTKPENLVEIEPLAGRLKSEMSASCHSSEFEQAVGTPPTDVLLGSSDQGNPDRPQLTRRQKPASMQMQRAERGPQDLSASERIKVHILVVEDNAINQQIAMKTIKKLGFAATAVWNGKEALEYLRDAKEGKKVKPGIILMDVQMPVIDGYKCTHVLRHHLPYKAYANDVPIVAMTASAIQGDKEKCQRAGMDDYLSKPVKSKTLEEMLVRWSLSRRREPTTPLPSSEVSNCSEPGEHCSNGEAPDVDVVSTLGGYASPAGLPADEDLTSSVLTPRPPTRNTSADAPQSPLPVAEDGISGLPAVDTPPPHSLRRSETDELAMKSQNDKLMGAAGSSLGAALAQAPAGRAADAAPLTEENVEKLQEQQQEQSRRRRPTI